MLNKETIKEIAVANGFKLKEQANGEMDLNPYVYDTINKAIAFYESKKNNGWISVDDDLPPNGTECFVLVDKYDLKEANPEFVWYVSCQNRYFNRINKTIYKDDHFICDEKSHVKVTHWQPLPNPPKE